MLTEVVETSVNRDSPSQGFIITHSEHQIPLDSTSNLVPIISPLAFVLGRCKEVDFVLNRSFA